MEILKGDAGCHGHTVLRVAMDHDRSGFTCPPGVPCGRGTQRRQRLCRFFQQKSFRTFDFL